MSNEWTFVCGGADRPEAGPYNFYPTYGVTVGAGVPDRPQTTPIRFG